jgi:hypothetical protein
MAQRTLPAKDIVAVVGIGVGCSDGEVWKRTINKRYEIRAKEGSESVEWFDSSSSHHPILISNWHTGIFMRGRENISVCLSIISVHLFLQINRSPNSRPRLVP